MVNWYSAGLADLNLFYVLTIKDMKIIFIQQ